MHETVFVNTHTSRESYILFFEALNQQSNTFCMRFDTFYVQYNHSKPKLPLRTHRHTKRVTQDETKYDRSNSFQKIVQKCKEITKIFALYSVKIYMTAQGFAGICIEKNDFACASMLHLQGILVDVARTFPNLARQT